MIKNVIAIIVATLLLTAGIAWADFPAQLNNFVAGDVIRSADWNLIEAELGTRSGRVATGTSDSLNFIVRNAQFPTTTLRVGLTASTTISGDTGTSTFVNGISLSAGCFLFGGSCLTASPTGANPTGTIGLSAVNGSATTFMRSDAAPALSQSIAPTWTGLHIFNTGGVIANASSSFGYFNSASSTIEVLAIPSLTSAILLTNANGVLAEYAGTSCTNQFVRSLSALGAATCATVGTADVAGLDISDDTNLAATYPAVLTGDAISVDFGTTTNNTWSGTNNFSANNTTLGVVLGSIDAGGATFFEIPNGAAPTCDDPGEICHDTTDNMVLVDDLVVAKGTVKIWAITVASTSPAFISSGLLPVPVQLDGYTITAIRCYVVSGTSKVIAVEDASANSSEDITCATTATSDDGSITNATYTAAELSNIDFGATSGAVDYVTIAVFGQWTRE